ncbi:MAG TPA: hypothetical protein VFN74_17395, partial [Chloroflexota bacterium]|nr:hypothetical protein [Chloroflexota bacterium]
MQISRLPQALVRAEHGMVKDHVVVVNEEGAQPLALRVSGAFAGYLAGALAELSAVPGAIEILERKLANAGLMAETRTLC